MLEARNIDVYIAGKGALLKDINFKINRGDRIGIIGRNGCGKSTLLNYLAQEQVPDGGSLEVEDNVTVHLVKQYLPDDEMTPLEFLKETDGRIKALNDSLENAENHEVEGICDALGQYEEEYDRRAPEILSHFGLSPEEMESPMRQLSGGFRMRIAITSALIQQPDVLLLDEPTNHLDLESVVWLETFLCDYSGAFAVVSHDINFLNAVTEKTLLIEQGSASLFTGNYDTFLLEYERARKSDLRNNEKLEKDIKRNQKFVDKFKSHPTRKGSATAKEKVIKKLKKSKADVIQETPVIPIVFPQPALLNDPIIEIEGGAIGYEEKTILDDVSISLQTNSCIFILGKNGQGKTTFVKALSDRLGLMSGQRTNAAGLKIGYYSQEQTDELNLENSVIQEFHEKVPDIATADLRSHLATFGFSADAITTNVADLSGGEKARLIFAIIAAAKPQLVILDEPTNHLDIQSQEELYSAITQFQGAVILISHDWHLLNNIMENRENVTCSLIDSGKIQKYEGTLNDYKDFLLSGEKTKKTNGNKSTKSLRAESREGKKSKHAKKMDLGFINGNKRKGKKKAEKKSTTSQPTLVVVKSSRN